jgi:cell division protein FtsQ
MSEVRRAWLISASGILAVAALVVLVSGALMARNGGALLPFRWIDVTRLDSGVPHVSAEQIRAVAAPAAAGGFFATRPEEVRERVLALPWVAEVEVRKHWPDVLEVRYSERELLGQRGDEELVDSRGAVFRARGAGETRGLPLLDASDAQMPELARRYRTAQADIEAQGRRIVAASMSRRGALEYRLDNGLVIRLGSRDVDQRWRRFVDSLPRLATLDPRPIAVADLRYTHGFAIAYADAVPPLDPNRPAPSP